MATDRMKRLKDLIDTLMEQPSSRDRDRLLSEVRSRVVDLDTGVTPRAMLPMHEPAPVISRPPAARRVTVAPKPQRVPAPAPASAGPVRWPAGLLTLDDTPLPHAPAYGDPTARPWTLGLRG